MNSRNSDSTSTIYQIAVRFGDDILQAGFTAIPNLVLDHYAALGITPGEMMFIIHVWQYWWTEKDPYPSLKTIAAKMNVSRRQVSNYTQSLKTKGYLLVLERQQPELGQVTSEYDFSPLIRAITRPVEGVKDISSPPMNFSSRGGMKSISRGPMKNTSTEEYTAKEYSKNNNTQHNKSFETSNIRKVHTKIDAGQNGEGLSRTSRSAPIESVGTVLKRRPGRPPKSTYTDPDRQIILDYMADFAREFADRAPLSSSTTRAYNLYKQSGVELSTFIGAMQQARSIVKERTASIRTTTNDPDRPSGVKAKMGYWFSVLEDVLGLRADEHSSAGLG